MQRRRGERRTGTEKVRTVPIRSVDEGPFVMEVWVEEGIDKGKEGGGKGEVDGDGDGKEGG